MISIPDNFLEYFIYNSFILSYHHPTTQAIKNPATIFIYPSAVYPIPMTEQTLAQRYIADCHPDILPEVYELYVKYFGEPVRPDPSKPNGAWIEEQCFLYLEELSRRQKA